MCFLRVARFPAKRKCSGNLAQLRAFLFHQKLLTAPVAARNGGEANRGPAVARSKRLPPPRRNRSIYVLPR
jgi:hypothetical protein